MITIVEKKKRSVLQEGRDNGMGFAFVKKVADNIYHTVQPMSPCKDYLHEIIVTEHCGVPTKAYGLRYAKRNNLFTEDVAFLGIKLLKKHNTWYNYSKSFEEDNEKLKTNLPHIVSALNWIEQEIGLEKLTEIHEANDDQYLVVVPIEWCKSTSAISLYSLLLRVLMVYDGTKDVMSFLKSYSYNGGDVSLLVGTIPKLELILKKRKLPPNRVKYQKEALKKGGMSPHDRGILAWDSNFLEVPLLG